MRFWFVEPSSPVLTEVADPGVCAAFARLLNEQATLEPGEPWARPARAVARHFSTRAGRLAKRAVE